jgi:hypothetical protein
MAKISKKQARLNDLRVQRVYGERCSGIQINVMDIGKVFKIGTDAIVAGADDQKLGDLLVAFVETIRKN